MFGFFSIQPSYFGSEELKGLITCFLQQYAATLNSERLICVYEREAGLGLELNVSFSCLKVLRYIRLGRQTASA